jgi:hypothetical protein
MRKRSATTDPKNLEEAMSSVRRIGTLLLSCALATVWHPLHATAPATARDGARDFDFNIGSWKTHVQRLQHPLTGSTTWITYEGTHIVRKVWGGRANLGELELDGPGGHLEGLALRLYNPQSHQWGIYFANSGGGTVGVPLVGEFKDGRGEFVDQEPFKDRTILVRTIWSDITATSCRSEQAFSDDGGKTWEVNWIATDTRVPDGAPVAQAAPAGPAGPAASGAPTPPDAGAHDFDFNLGSWSSNISRLQHPLTGETTWYAVKGAVAVRPIWNGRANLEEIEAEGPAGHLEGLTLRLYNPQSHQWTLSWANANDGVLTQPLTGEFKTGRGQFIDQEAIDGRTILVRQVYTVKTQDTHHFEQAFSDDGGKTWETNWSADLTRGAR